jgi:hypothetical protein
MAIKYLQQGYDGLTQQIQVSGRTDPKSLSCMACTEGAERGLVVLDRRQVLNPGAKKNREP